MLSKKKQNFPNQNWLFYHNCQWVVHFVVHDNNDNCQISSDLEYGQPVFRNNFGKVANYAQGPIYIRVRVAKLTIYFVFILYKARKYLNFPYVTFVLKCVNNHDLKFFVVIIIKLNFNCEKSVLLMHSVFIYKKGTKKLPVGFEIDSVNLILFSYTLPTICFSPKLLLLC